VEKCLAAGFSHVAVVSLKKSRLEKLGKILFDALPGESRTKVHLFTPEELLSWLAGQPAEETTGMVGGYRVKVRHTAPQDAKARRVAEIVARSMGRLGKDDV
jgi:hypothetical protein